MTPREKLRRNWANWKKIFKVQPLDDVRSYFGEKIGFYFAFMDFYARALVPPSIVGILALVYGELSYAGILNLSPPPAPKRAI